MLAEGTSGLETAGQITATMADMVIQPVTAVMVGVEAITNGLPTIARARIAADEPVRLVARAYGVDEKTLRTTLKR